MCGRSYYQTCYAYHFRKSLIVKRKTFGNKTCFLKEQHLCILCEILLFIIYYFIISCFFFVVLINNLSTISSVGTEEKCSNRKRKEFYEYWLQGELRNASTNLYISDIKDKVHSAMYSWWDSDGFFINVKKI